MLKPKTTHSFLEPSASIVPNGSPNTSSKQTCQQTNGHTKVRYFSPCLSQWRAMICNTVRLSAVWRFATFGRQMQRLY